MDHDCHNGYVTNPPAVRIITGVRYHLCPQCHDGQAIRDVERYRFLKEMFALRQDPAGLARLQNRLLKARTIKQAREIMLDTEVHITLFPPSK